jgi:hypothetical protein
VTDLDQRIHEDLERLIAAAPLPPTVDEIARRHRPPGRSRRPLLAAAAVTVVLAAIAGAVALRHTSGDGSDGVAAPRVYGSEQRPPPGAGPLPRLIFSVPGWLARSERDWPPQPFYGTDLHISAADGLIRERRFVVYGAEDAWRPLVEVTTTELGPAQPSDDPPATEPGNIDRLPHGALAMGWLEGRTYISVKTAGFSEEDLRSFAEDLVRESDGRYALPEPPDGTVELYRSDDPNPTGGNSGAYFQSADFDPVAEAGTYAEISFYGGGVGALWNRLSDKLFGSYEDEELAVVRGQRALIARSGADYRVIWPERDGDVVAEVSYLGPRSVLDDLLDSLVEVDEESWQRYVRSLTPLPVPDPGPEPEPDVTVFMRSDVDNLNLHDRVYRRLEASDRVESIVFYDHDDAHAEFVERVGDDPAMVESIDPADLPTSYRVAVRDHDVSAIRDVLDAIRQVPGVQQIELGSLFRPATGCPEGYRPSADDGDACVLA